MSRRPSRRALRHLPAAAVLLAAASPAVAQDAAPATELAPVEATATAWRSWMPVEGFVAPTTTTGTKTGRVPGGGVGARWAPERV